MMRSWSISVCMVVCVCVAATATAQVTVPNLVGLPKTASGSNPSATSVLQAAGLALGTVKYGSSATQLPGRVYRQDPLAGTSVASGTTVKVLLASPTSPPLKDQDPASYPSGTYVDGVWPWGTNPSRKYVSDFCEAQEALVDNTTLLSLIPNRYLPFFPLLEPEAGDINGTSYVMEKDPWPSGSLHFVINGNGINDCHVELRLVGEALKASFTDIPAHGSYAGLTHAKVLLAANKIAEQLEQDVGTYWAVLGSAGNGMQQALIGHMLIGDGDAELSDYHDGDPNRIDCHGSGGFIKAAMFLLGGIVSNSEINFSNFERMPEFFAMEGDADGDGASNQCELNYANDTTVFSGLTADQRNEKYVELALNPAKGPRLCYCTCGCLAVDKQSHDRWYEAGDTMELFASFSPLDRSLAYAWTKDGEPVEAATSSRYVRENLAEGDSGLYRCTATEIDVPANCKGASKGSAAATVMVRVVPEGTLPVAAPVALGALIGALLGGGSLVALRRRR